MRKMLCFDIETIPNWELINANLDVAARSLKEPGDIKSTDPVKMEEVNRTFATSPIWGRIVCISCGSRRDDIQFHCVESETETLEWFLKVLAERQINILVGFFSYKFDIPFINYRSVVGGLKIPYVLNPLGKKPWEIGNIDLEHVLQFGAKKNVSLEANCIAMGIKSPKADCNGSKVSDLFKEKKYSEIGQYCCGDVLATMEIFNKLYLSDAFSIIWSK